MSAVANWPKPTNAKEPRSFLGLTGYYRRFIDGYAKIAGPLHHLTSLCGYTKKRGRKRKTRRQDHVKKVPSGPFHQLWTKDCENAFQNLKNKLSSAPILAYADITKPFVLHIDACRNGLGAILLQEHDGNLKPVACASKSLQQSEKNYPAHKLEFYALKWAVTDQFKDYLYMAKGTKVLTDNNPLTYVLTTAKLDATGHRWLAAVANFDFTIKYKPGHTNQDADAVSRRSTSFDGDLMDLTDQQKMRKKLEARLPTDDSTQTCPRDVMEAIFARSNVTLRQDNLSEESGDESFPLACCLGITSYGIPDYYNAPTCGLPGKPMDWKEE